MYYDCLAVLAPLLCYTEPPSSPVWEMLKLSAIACLVALVACAPENPTWPGKKSCKVLALSGGGSYGVFEALVMFVVHVLTFIHL